MRRQTSRSIERLLGLRSACLSSSNTFFAVLTSWGSPHYFKICKISAVAIIKMVCRRPVAYSNAADRIRQVIHARSGVPYEIMGLMQGKVMGDTLVIMDSFALPVQGTETRVNAANEANEYMVQYLTESERVRFLVIGTLLQYLMHRQVGRVENAIGWYHSHPGYGCWLSGIDVNTQMTNQKFQDPFVAVVVCRDWLRTHPLPDFA